MLDFFKSLFTHESHDRINQPIQCFNKCSDKVLGITRWNYNKNEGQWKVIVCPGGVSFENAHPELNNIQIKTFIHNGKTNYVLIVSFTYIDDLDTLYGTKTVVFNKKHYYLLTKKEYEFIISPSKHKTFNLPCISPFGEYTENRIIRMIIEKRYGKNKFSITKHKNVIRFHFNGGYTKFNLFDLMKIEYFEVAVNKWDKLKIDEN